MRALGYEPTIWDDLPFDDWHIITFLAGNFLKIKKVLNSSYYLGLTYVEMELKKNAESHSKIES